MTQGFYLNFYQALISLHTVTLKSNIIALFTPKTAHPAEQSVNYVSNMPIAVTLEELQFRRVSDKLLKWSCNGTGVSSAGQSAGEYVFQRLLSHLVLALFFVKMGPEKMLALSDLEKDRDHLP